MGRFKTRLVLVIPCLTLLVSLSYLFFFLQISETILKAEDVEQLRNTILFSGLIITSLVVILSVLISFFLSQRLNRPIKELVKVVKEISRGNFAHRLKIRGYSEIQELVSSFNHMFQQLKIFKEKTRKHNQNLEKIAKDRAKE